MEAQLFPVDSCILDTVPNATHPNALPCSTSFDYSHLVVRPTCNNDTISFVITNTGDGDMNCWSQVRIYIDGQLSIVDSVMLLSGGMIQFDFLGNGGTWRLEVDQHPLHRGNSQPSATIENCGTGNWTPNLVNALAQDDADPIVDIYCGLVTGSYDPNDKRGFPLGIGSNNEIEPNQDIEYMIRFQNTGTDTAFTVVVRDTLSADLDISTIKTGVSSHAYSFRVYGERILEWTFNNIMLPDSNVNEPASNGFLMFKIKQQKDLPLGTVIRNSAAIYFDFNAPIITNMSRHLIQEQWFVNIDKVEPKTASNYLLYPNPTTGLIRIEQEHLQPIQIQVITQLGIILKEEESVQKITDLNIGNLPTGIYYVIINNGAVSVSYKVMKL
jgi:uncharacterized repeat protein (TIGR01451 family)